MKAVQHRNVLGGIKERRLEKAILSLPSEVYAKIDKVAKERHLSFASAVNFLLGQVDKPASTCKTQIGVVKASKTIKKPGMDTRKMSHR